MGIRKSMHNALSKAGIAVYLPGQQEGECEKAYVVIGDGGVYTLGRATGRKSFLVTGYVPASRSLDLRPLLASATMALAPIRSIHTNGEVSPEVIDTGRKAVFASIEYTALCAI